MESFAIKNRLNLISDLILANNCNVPLIGQFKCIT